MKAVTNKSARAKANRMGVGSWVVIIVLLLFLLAAAVPIYRSWRLGNGAGLPLSAYIAMALGIVFSLGVGFGLMALLFYSSRKGYDEPPVLMDESERAESANPSTENAEQLTGHHESQ
ncbi:flagellar basal body-associated protein FliL [Bradyrhizobium japonicum]